MAVTTTTAEQALKIVYTDLLRNQINVESSPLFNEIEATSKDISGKEVRKYAPYGVNGGVGAGGEAGPLPTAGGNMGIQFVSTTKNFYGVFALTDKSIKASRNNAGAFVNLLSNEIKGLTNAVKLNYGRQIFTDGSGILTTCKANSSKTLLEVNSTQYILEGMTIDILETGGVEKTGGNGRRVLGVDRTNNKIKISGAAITTAATDIIVVQNSYNMEMTGLAEIFKTTGSLYGVDRTEHYWMVPYMNANTGPISDLKIQRAINRQRDIAGSKINFICVASDVEEHYQEYLEATKRHVNTLDLKGGFKSISYNGIPFFSDRFMPANTMDLLDLKQFSFHQMGDWDWFEVADGKILVQDGNAPIWKATLVKYGELICDHPGGQARLSGITSRDNSIGVNVLNTEDNPLGVNVLNTEDISIGVNVLNTEDNPVPMVDVTNEETNG